MSYVDFTAAIRRRDILAFLNANGGVLNEELVARGIEHLGHRRLSRDDLRAELQFLCDHALLRLEYAAATAIAVLTRRGAECAKGLVVIEGIAQPEVGV